jgi:L-amino acid N-acyltransferase YncA
MPELQIRDAVLGDAAAIADLFGYFAQSSSVTFETAPLPADEWGRRVRSLAASGHPFLAAEIGGDLVGFAYASPWRPKPAYRHSVEDTLYVSPDHHGRGVGKALLEMLIARCRAAGFRTMIAVIVRSGGDASVRLHRGLGFTEVGSLRNVGYKFGEWIDTTLMQLDLESGDDG